VLLQLQHQLADGGVADLVVALAAGPAAGADDHVHGQVLLAHVRQHIYEALQVIAVEAVDGGVGMGVDARRLQVAQALDRRHPGVRVADDAIVHIGIRRLQAHLGGVKPGVAQRRYIVSLGAEDAVGDQIHPQAARPGIGHQFR
jgi:hypothetical protein